MLKLIMLLLLFAGNTATIAQPCPKSGDATTPQKKDLNIAKNKTVTVASGKKPEVLPLKNLITTTKRKDRNLYANGAYVVTEGILVSFEEEGPESCNCQQASKAKKNGDVHIYIGLKANAAKKNCIVVEITPAYKKKHPNYADQLKNNTKVKITGYLLYDFLHENAAVNTCTSCEGAWRKTCWEIHPVTDIRIVE